MAFLQDEPQARFGQFSGGENWTNGATVDPATAPASQPQTTAGAPPPVPPAQTQPPASGGAQPPSGMDPDLWSLYQKSGVTPGGNGSGFADWQYWQDKIGSSGDKGYILGRLGDDLAGKGVDQPTGTPGQGAWSGSGGGMSGGTAPGGAFSMSAISGLAGGAKGNPAYHYEQSPQDSQLFQTLMGRANQSLNVDPNDPIIKGQVDAFKATQDRGVKDFLSASAEHGGPHSNMDAQARSAYEKAGQATSGLQSQLMQHELNSRRAEIQAALSQEGGMLSQQDQMALQRELGLINSQLSAQGLQLGQQQINSNNDQFSARFGLDSTNQANYWDSLRRGLV